MMLARMRGPVQLFDADLGLGNSHILLGLRPRHNFQHYFERRAQLEELNLQGPHGLRLLPGGSGISRLAQLERHEIARLAQELSFVIEDARLLVVDSPAGIAVQTLSFMQSASCVLLVVTPELTSLTDAYALVKCLHLRDPSTRFIVVVNRCEEEGQGREVFERLSGVAGRFLSLPLHFLGSVPEDPAAVRSALAAKMPVVLHEPDARVAVAISQIASELEELVWEFESARDGPDFCTRLWAQY